MTDLENICDDIDCNCRNVEPNFRHWYHTPANAPVMDNSMLCAESTKSSSQQKDHIEAVDKIAFGLEAVIDVVGSDERYRALAKTSLEQAIMWIHKGISNYEEKE